MQLSAGGAYTATVSTIPVCFTSSQSRRPRAES